MHSSTLLLPIVFALGAVADPVAEPVAFPLGLTPARQFDRSPDDLSRRGTPDLDPTLICGQNYNDCGNGERHINFS